MRKYFNSTFRNFLKEYNLPSGLSFSVKFPAGVKKILNDKIVNNSRGITLKSFGVLPKVDKTGTSNIAMMNRKKSWIEDFNNHFHVDWYVNPQNAKTIFMLGIKTMIALAEKFEKARYKGIRFYYYFQTPELSRLFDVENGFSEYANDEQYFSDRLTFFKRRKGEEVKKITDLEDRYGAIMIIDI